MNLTFQDAKIQMDGGVWLCIKVNEPALARTFILDKQNRLYDCEIKEHREKRSLDANAYEDTGVVARKRDYEDIQKRKTEAWRNALLKRLNPCQSQPNETGGK